MREIKFRAWDKKRNEMVLVINMDWQEQMIADEDEAFHYFDEVEIMQYTGRKDINETGIYDGDICARVGCGQKYKVFWSESMLSWRMECIDTDHYFGIRELHSHDWEVIGNIHENKELLEGK